MTEQKQKYLEHLKSEYWQNVKKSVRERDGNRCKVCNSSQLLEVHHRTYAHVGCEMDFLSDLTLLCNSCHGLFHKSAAPLPKPKQNPKPKAERVQPLKPLVLPAPKYGQGMARAAGKGYVERIRSYEPPSEKPSGKWIIFRHHMKGWINQKKESLDWIKSHVCPISHGWPKKMIGRAVPLECIKAARRNSLHSARLVYSSEEQALAMLIPVTPNNS